FQTLLSHEETLYKVSPIFSKSLSIIKNEYVEEIEPEKLFEGAYQGILEALDPISSYLNKDEVKRLSELENKNSGDIGIFAVKRGGLYQVLGLLEDSPAERVGIKVGDILSGIDNTSALFKSYYQLRLSLKGEPKTKVSLRWIRNMEKFKADIEREIIYDPQWKVVYSTKDSLLIRIKSIYPPLSEELKKYISEQINTGLKKVIFDIRNCWDGKIEEGIELANLFIRGGKIVLQKKEGKNDEILLKKAPVFEDLKLELVSGRGTFGSAEIFTYLVKSSKRGKIHGEQTLGLTSFQQFFSLSNGCGFILKTKEIINPSGKPLISEGLIPDNKVNVTSDFLKELVKNIS
ncbi:MAG: S41 family peptidase, partial [Candidatus Aminicenantia bacterium]